MNNDNMKNSNDSDFQSKIMKQIHDLGETLERAGEKVEKNGWETIGQAIHKLGDTLEHLNEKSAKPMGASKTEAFSGSAVNSSDKSASNDYSKDTKGFTPSKSATDTTTDSTKGSRSY